MKIGFIGLGAMGAPMAENLHRAGRGDLIVHDRDPAAMARLAATAQTIGTAADLAGLADCEIVVTMLPDSPVTNAVVLGADGTPGLVDVLQSGALVVDMGSSDPLDSVRLHTRLAEAEIDFVDAPVSGGVTKARAGTLTILVGGDAAVLARARPILEAMGTTIVPTGRIGSAHAMKALNNYVYAAGLLAVAEALAIARTSDLDVEVFAEVLNGSSGRNVASETKLAQFMIPETFAGGFALRLQAKDLALAESLVAGSGVAAPQLALVARLWREASVALGADADNTEIYRHLAGLGGRAAREGETST